MREFTISAGDGPCVRALSHGRALVADGLPGRPDGPLLLTGHNGLDLAAVAAWTLIAGHSIVLQPEGVTPVVTGIPIIVDAVGTHVRAAADRGANPHWQVGMYTSGSTSTARAYGFTLDQLDQLAAWYTTIYRVTSASVVVTHLPVTYNFTFVAGAHLAATLGAHLHLVDSPEATFVDAAQLARTHDRCIILGNPVLLAEPPAVRLPDTVLVDSGGAPLSTTAISHYREHVADLREGYGLTETGSLTHFDAESAPASLGTVGTAMPGVETTIEDREGQPYVAVRSPALGTPIGHSAPTCRGWLTTTDLGVIDAVGRLRVLGRADDHSVGGLWPREILDVIGSLLGTACALVRHPTPDTVHIRLREPLPDNTLAAIRARVANHANTSPTATTIDIADERLLHSHKLPRPVTSVPES